jgi:hypothetical protein
LGWSEQCKDGTKMGVGCPEYVVLLHKPQSDRTRSYADVPVTHEKPLCADKEGNQVPFHPKLPPVPGTGYSRARWQIDAHSFWRSSGDRLLRADELLGYGPDVLVKKFTETTLQRIYDHAEHVKLGEILDAKFALPSTYMSLAPGAHDPNTWHDVNRMRTLNGAQSMAGREQHVCPLQVDIVERLIERFSNKGDVVFDPFGGIMTVPYCAIRMGRYGRGVELHEGYYRDGLGYCEMAERQIATPTLFDMEGIGREAAE